MDEDTSSTAPAEDPRPLKRIRLDTDAAQSSPADDSAKNDAPVDPLPSERIKPVTDVAHPSPVDDGGKDDAKIASGSAKKSKDTAKRDSAGWAKSRRGKDKDGKNAGRRGRTSRNDEDAAKGERVEGEDGVQKQKAPRLPKRLCALLIGFCGTGCNGMQIQPNVRTIEGVLFDAMVKAGAVSDDNANDPTKVNLGRAARTDAGVHAAGNLVSIKMITEVPGVPDIVARINEELPPEIRVWSYVRVQNSFNARTSCDSRKYTYFFPTYLLIPPKPDSNLARTLSRSIPTTEGATSQSFWPAPESESASASSPAPADSEPQKTDLLRKRAWRIEPAQLEALRSTAQRYEGTHNFHNFTVGREFSDRSCQRHMKKIEIGDPAVYGETEWISVMFHGQSFMLHQIRKMMSALVLSVRTGTPAKIIDELYGPRTVFVPKMPALGLLLEHPIFESYNNRMEAVNAKLQPTDVEYRPPIEFAQHKDAMEKFKQVHIYDNMRATEDRAGIFDAWVRMLDKYGGSDLLYLNAEGIVPEEAVIRKGQRRENPFRERKKFDATSFAVGTDVKVDADAQDEAEDDDDEDLKLDKKGLVDMEG